MSTQPKPLVAEFIVDRAIIAPTRLTLIHDAGNYSDLEHQVAGVASRGMHPATLGVFTSLYALMLATFWASFAYDAPTALILTVVTVLMLMYFSLVIGGIMLADSAVVGEHQRDFSDFLRGQVDIATGLISGREAVMQILLLPSLMLVLAIAIGIIARVSQLS